MPGLPRASLTSPEGALGGITAPDRVPTARECSRLCYYVAFVEVVQIDEFRDTSTVALPVQTMNCPLISGLEHGPEHRDPEFLRLLDLGVPGCAAEAQDEDGRDLAKSRASSQAVASVFRAATSSPRSASPSSSIRHPGRRCHRAPGPLPATIPRSRAVGARGAARHGQPEGAAGCPASGENARFVILHPNRPRMAVPGPACEA